MREEHHATLSLAAQWLSGAAAVSFASSALINYIVFSWWGLDFLQIASTTDVISSGIEVFVRLLGPAFIFMSGWLVARIPVFYLMPARMIRFITIFAITLVEILTIFFASPEGDAISWVLLLTLGLFGFYQSYSVARGDVHGVEAAVVAIVVGAMLAFTGVTLVRQLVLHGFEPRRLVLAADEPCRGDVIWMGERAIVLRCPDQQVAILFGPENVPLQLRPAEYQPKILTLPAKPSVPARRTIIEKLRSLVG
jgi:hypothetical protein